MEHFSSHVADCNDLYFVINLHCNATCHSVLPNSVSALRHGAGGSENEDSQPCAGRYSHIQAASTNVCV